MMDIAEIWDLLHISGSSRSSSLEVEQQSSLEYAKRPVVMPRVPVLKKTAKSGEEGEIGQRQSCIAAYIQTEISGFIYSLN